MFISQENQSNPDSLMNKMTPGSKLGQLFILMTAALASSQISGLIMLFIFTLCLYPLSGLPTAGLFKRILPLLPLIVAVGLFQTLFAVIDDTSPLWWSWRFIVFSQADIFVFSQFVLRFLTVIALFFLYTSLLTTNQISHGVEELLAPLSRIRIPVFELGLVLTITFRFIPLLGDELERIEMAQRGRGAQAINARGKGGLIHNLRARIPMLVPLFLSALERAYILAEAMESRGYQGPTGRSRYILFKKSARDRIMLLGVWLILGAVIFINIIQLDHITGGFFYEKFIG